VEFPESARSPEAMYRAAMIHLSYFKDQKAGMELLSRLVSDYPGSDFAAKARKHYERQARNTDKRHKSQTTNHKPPRR
jgi:TolA-binding protein